MMGIVPVHLVSIRMSHAYGLGVGEIGAVLHGVFSVGGSLTPRTVSWRHEAARRGPHAQSWTGSGCRNYSVVPSRARERDTASYTAVKYCLSCVNCAAACADIAGRLLRPDHALADISGASTDSRAASRSRLLFSARIVGGSRRPPAKPSPVGAACTAHYVVLRKFPVRHECTHRGGSSAPDIERAGVRSDHRMVVLMAHISIIVRDVGDDRRGCSRQWRPPGKNGTAEGEACPEYGGGSGAPCTLGMACHYRIPRDTPTVDTPVPSAALVSAPSAQTPSRGGPPGNGNARPSFDRPHHDLTNRDDNDRVEQNSRSAGRSTGRHGPGRPPCSDPRPPPRGPPGAAPGAPPPAPPPWSPTLLPLSRPPLPPSSSAAAAPPRRRWR